ncbi:hypothetical protein DM860_009956 [Cuscuta australis]|uniref:Peroxisomal membrane protein MPV17 n=1 Tax=Cuscuta australis TaxID=267555 RepID=A0A328DCF0_9ASTE|nr:hypothetical protein DM860_009956 [Cuscuta australis]
MLRSIRIGVKLHQRTFSMASTAGALTGKNLLGLRFHVSLPRAPSLNFSATHTHRIPRRPRYPTRPLSPLPALFTPSSAPSLKNLGPFQSGSNLFRATGVSNANSSAGGGYGGSGENNARGGGGGGNGGGGGGGDEGKRSFLTWYFTLLEKYPMCTKAITSALLTCIGDLICQLWSDQVPPFDGMRTFRFTLLGLVLVGPSLHFWYLYLSRLVTTTGASGAVLRLLLDQLVFAPVFIGVFLSTLVTLEGQPSQVIPKLQQVWASAVLANWQLWIPFQFFNFRFVPQQFQVLAANFIALIWNVILSYKAHKKAM